MSDLSYFAIGAGIGLLMVVPVFVIYRQELASNVRKLLGLPDSKDAHMVDPDTQMSPSVSSKTHISGSVISLVVAVGLLTLGIGAILNNLFAVISAVAMLVSILAAVFITRVVATKK